MGTMGMGSLPVKFVATEALGSIARVELITINPYRLESEDDNSHIFS
jgi:hypothetical protein